MDEGEPIAYQVLDKGVPVLASDGQQVGTVHHVVAAPEQDIFHGLVILTDHNAQRFVQADDVQALHEHGVDLKIDSAAVTNLPEPGGGAPVYDEDPGEMKGWHHWVHMAGMRGDWNRKS
jgi:hypothetical protein